MTNIGAEVGQKMRSAIKAKLLELNCYVDDELPDYVMVMVANKRTKSQMKEDLQLFLSAKTSTFVDWLHIVLKKLKEVTVTNPEVYKKTAKRKLDEITDVNIKKEKKDKKIDKKVKTADEVNRSVIPESTYKSLTDDLPINANRLAEQRKIVIMKENQLNNKKVHVIEDNFDIPLLSEVNMSSEKELEDIERKIKNVKSRLGLLVDSDSEDKDCINIKAEPENNKVNEPTMSRKIQLIEDDNTSNQGSSKRTEHTRITFNDSDENESQSKRKSILERLGKRRSNDTDLLISSKKFKIDSAEFRKDEEMFVSTSKSKERKSLNRDDKKLKKKESVLSRLGVMSKVSVPQKEFEVVEETVKGREVPSMIKIKPRVIPPDAPQANKNLLLKAVAEAQKSIAQTPTVGNNIKPDALFTKRYKEKLHEEKTVGRKLPEAEKNKIKKFIVSVPNKEKHNSDNEENSEYVPKSVKKSHVTPKYIPSIKKPSNVEDDSLVENGKVMQQFIVTLDGIEKTKFKETKNIDDDATEKSSIKSRLDKKKSPSPIIFDKITSPVKSKSNIPDKLPIVHAPSSIKNKERCKYWPSCRHGEKCEFVHPTSNCDMFPQCKFGDKCLFLHPSCKFGSSCTRRDCPYIHLTPNKSRNILPTTPVKLPSQSMQTCKFFPNCTNINCTFYHPKPCKFGKYCKNQDECNFSHSFVPSKSSLTWRSK